MSNLIIRLVEFESPEYHEMVDLRDRILRKPLGLSFTSEQLASESNQWHVGAFLDGKLIGCLLMLEVDERTIKMRQVAVDASMQGQGIGTRLVSYCEEFCIKKGYCRIELHARKEAVKFYQDLAYETLGNEFVEVTIPHFKMVKSWCA